MAYKKIKAYKMSEDELRDIWKNEYCNPPSPIYTFDKVRVTFYESMFNHVFYESANKKAKDKSILSYNRLEKIHWIKEVLCDPTSILKQGWDKDIKSYDNSRRVALVKDNYIVIIRFTSFLKASFVTAYELQTNEDKVKESPDWIKDKRFVE